jgi:hypothetical protein
MSAAASIIADLSRSGVRLERRGDRLHIEAPRGTVTPAMRIVLTEHKAALLDALNDDPRATLARIADELGVSLRKLDADDAATCHGLPLETLRAYVLALRDSDLREQGQVPAGETCAVLCKHCGPVFVHPSVASVAPVVAEWPRVLGCPWCFVRNRAAIPRPPVRCDQCAQFAPDKTNPIGGMCGCRAGCNPQRPWPNVLRECSEFKRGDQNG